MYQFAQAFVHGLRDPFGLIFFNRSVTGQPVRAFETGMRGPTGDALMSLITALAFFREMLAFINLQTYYRESPGCNPEQSYKHKGSKSSN